MCRCFPGYARVRRELRRRKRYPGLMVFTFWSFLSVLTRFSRLMAECVFWYYTLGYYCMRAMGLCGVWYCYMHSDIHEAAKGRAVASSKREGAVLSSKEEYIWT